MVIFLNHIASILYKRGLTCGAVYPLLYFNFFIHLFWVIACFTCYITFNLLLQFLSDIALQSSFSLTSVKFSRSESVILGDPANQSTTSKYSAKAVIARTDKTKTWFYIQLDLINMEDHPYIKQSLRGGVRLLLNDCDDYGYCERFGILPKKYISKYMSKFTNLILVSI